MTHIYKICSGFLLAAVCLALFQNCGESIDYGAYQDGATNSSSVSSGTPANILAMPATINKTEGQDLIINTTVDGTNVQLQWYKNGSPINGATSKVLSKNNLSTSDAGNYKLRAETANPAAVVERTTVVSVTAAPVATPTPTPPAPTPTPVPLPPAPSITSQPQSSTMAYFSSVAVTNPTAFYLYDGTAFVLDANNQLIPDVTLSVNATGTGLKYQWQRKASGQSNWQIVSGATSRTYKFTMTSLSQAGQYRVQVTDSHNRSVVSSAANVSTYEFVININYPYYNY